MSLEPDAERSADAVVAALALGRLTPASFREALARIPTAQRDEWVDRVVGIDVVPEDERDLPRGCAPYLPCAVDAIVRALDGAGVTASDVFVDVGSGLGRAAVLTHLATGASAIGLEIQAHLAAQSRALVDRLGLAHVAVVHGDAVALTRHLPIGTVFFLYCPFTGERVERILDDLEAVARTKTIRVCAVDMPLPPRNWLEPIASMPDVGLFRSVQR